MFKNNVMMDPYVNVSSVFSGNHKVTSKCSPNTTTLHIWVVVGCVNSLSFGEFG